MPVLRRRQVPGRIGLLPRGRGSEDLMPRVDDQYLESRRREIVDAAMTCFSREGFHRTTMQDIVRETGLSAGAIYRYFKSKEDIVAAIAEEWVGRGRRRLGRRGGRGLFAWRDWRGRWPFHASARGSRRSRRTFRNRLHDQRLVRVQHQEREHDREQNASFHYRRCRTTRSVKASPVPGRGRRSISDDNASDV